MSMVHFIDTSVFVELLNVPGMNERYAEIRQDYELLAQNGDTFVLPVAVLVETGNHIAHIPDGTLRRRVALKFVDLVKRAINMEGNWNVMPEISEDILERILVSFPKHASSEIGFGDVSIIEQFEDYWQNRQPIGEMRIWSLDDHLSAYQKTGGLSRRKNS